MINIDANSTKAIYEQIYDEFVKLIVAKVLKPDEKIPSVRELAASIRINPNTIQKAYKLLENDKYIYSEKGKGNFVNSNEESIKVYSEQIEKTIQSGIIDLKKVGVSDEYILSLVDSTLKGAEKDATGKRAE